MKVHKTSIIESIASFNMNTNFGIVYVNFTKQFISTVIRFFCQKRKLLLVKLIEQLMDTCNES